MYFIFKNKTRNTPVPSTISKKLNQSPQQVDQFGTLTTRPYPHHYFIQAQVKHSGLYQRTHQRANMYPHMFKIAIKSENARPTQKPWGPIKPKGN